VGVGGRQVVEDRRHRDEKIAFRGYRETLNGLLG
jgi:hypothetical protein